ncbi:MAG: hypothetical protein HY906_19335 [Deltaproteobacteria bacterium]|nr:hypothetical protein [Deltaproteobacteria bacterium]
MTRTQVYLPPGHHRALRREARERGISLTELVRRLVADHVEARGGLPAVGKEAVLAFVALGHGGRADVSERHDEALDEALRAGAVR